MTINQLPVPRTAITATTNTRPTGQIIPGAGPQSAPPPIPSRCAPKSLMNNEVAVNPPKGIGSLTKTQIKALLLQIAYSESRVDYSAVGVGNQLGKYQFDTDVLVEYKYIKPDFFRKYTQFDQIGSLGAVKIDQAWTNREGMNSVRDFLAATGVQEKVMFQRLTDLNTQLQNNRAILPQDTVSTRLGMLYVAHRIGLSAAKRWRDTGVTEVSTTREPAGVYFSLGRYAGEVLSAATKVR